MKYFYATVPEHERYETQVQAQPIYLRTALSAAVRVESLIANYKRSFPFLLRTRLPIIIIIYGSFPYSYIYYFDVSIAHMISGMIMKPGKHQRTKQRCLDPC